MEMTESCVPPGFRFHPTEEELVGYYLKRKITSLKIDLDVIVDVDLYKIEPWDIQDRCRLGYEEQTEWYFFSHKDKKYPTGTRTNRATGAGFWKATGRDKAILSKNTIIGMRKTLVFYKGRAPNGRKTEWIMHEYRLQTSQLAPPQEEGWVVCRAFKKPIPNQNQRFEAWTSHPPQYYYMRDYGNIFRPPNSYSQTTNSTRMHMDMVYPNHATPFTPNSPFNPEQDLIDSNCTHFQNQLIELPELDSPPISTSLATKDCTLMCNGSENEEFCEDRSANYGGTPSVDWKNLDELLLTESFLQPNFEHDQLNAQNHQSNHHDTCFPHL